MIPNNFPSCYWPFLARTMITRKLVSGSHHLFHTSRYSQPLFSRFYTCASPQSTSILRPCPVSFHHYSTTAESQSSDSSSEVPPPPSSSSSPDPSSREQDPIKQQIDAKDREIIDLKVRTFFYPYHLGFDDVADFRRRIDTYVVSPTFETYKTALSEMLTKRDSSPFRDSPAI